MRIRHTPSHEGDNPITLGRARALAKVCKGVWATEALIAFAQRHESERMLGHLCTIRGVMSNRTNWPSSCQFV